MNGNNSKALSTNIVEQMTREWIILIKQAVNACCQRPRFADVMVSTQPQIDMSDALFTSMRMDEQREGRLKNCVSCYENIWLSSQ